MLFFILLYTVICTSAENITNFNLKHYSIEDGLATNSISTIIQDSKGYIWIGTEKGLCRFDGKKIKIFHNFDQNESINPKINNIISICQINEDELWIGTEKGLFIFEYKTESYKPFTYSEKETNIKKEFLHTSHASSQIKAIISGLEQAQVKFTDTIKKTKIYQLKKLA